MRGRALSHRAQDGLAFAVRIRVRLPPDAPKGLLSDVLVWLLSHSGREGFAHRRMLGDHGPLEVFFFRRIADGEALLSTFPDLELVNELTANPCPSPRVPGNWTEMGGAES